MFAITMVVVCQDTGDTAVNKTALFLTFVKLSHETKISMQINMISSNGSFIKKNVARLGIENGGRAGTKGFSEEITFHPHKMRQQDAEEVTRRGTTTITKPLRQEQAWHVGGMACDGRCCRR